MKLGFTGTRFSMTKAQAATFRLFMQERRPEELHHGCCIGADAQAGLICRELLPDTRIVLHPPLDSSLVESCSGDEVREKLTHFARNRAIVEEADFVVGTPRDAKEQPEGGTWYTLRYAANKGKPVCVIWPNGTFSLDWQPAPKLQKIKLKLTKKDRERAEAIAEEIERDADHLELYP